MTDAERAAGAQGVQTGTGNTQHNHYGTAVGGGVAWPVLVGALPDRADKYQPRDDLSAAVAGAGAVVLGAAAPQPTTPQLATPAPVAPAPCGRVLSGLGGVGKTQLAADHAHRLWLDGRVDLVVWISATTRKNILVGYSRAATRVGVATEGAPDAARRFVEWLHGTNRRWLVVLDDLTTPAHLNTWWPPATPTGQTVVTTRRRDAVLAGDGRVWIDVGWFTPEQAMAYLTAKLHPDALAEAAALAADLGHLPLALSHAAAYIADRGLTCAAYRTRLANRRLSTVMPGPGAQPDQDTRTVAATWSLSIDVANGMDPAGVAGPLMDLASLLDPNGIPHSLFTSPPVLAYLGAELGRDVTPDQATDALHALHRLHLVTLPRTVPTTPANPAARQYPVVTVHGLVQRATREHLDADGASAGAANGAGATTDGGRYARTARAAADALLHAWPDSHNDPVLTTVLHTNTITLHDRARSALWTPDGHPLLFHAGASLGRVGQVEAARDHYQHLHDIAVDLLGPDHPDTLTTRHNLADWRGHAGDAAGAAIAMEELLADYLRVLGPDHPTTLGTRNNLACWRGHAGDAAGAAAAIEDLLTDYLRVLGPDHPSTRTARHNLAYWSCHAGDARAAAAAFDAMLAERPRH